MATYSIRKEKIALRKKILSKRNSLTIAEIKEKSLKIKSSLFNLKEFKEADNIMFFVSFRSEVMTDFMIKEALDLGKKVIVPRVNKRTTSLQISYIDDFNTDLTFGAYGILEPKSDQCQRAKKNDVDIVIVPGAAFSVEGNRVGYGLGYYDRFFDNLNKDVSKIALAFELQIVKKVPTSKYDVTMDMIITEERGIRCNK
jgi:5-formyltetrahydrofolate cyclo-ligase